MSSQRASKKEQANKLNELELVEEEEEQLPPSRKAKRQVASGTSLMFYRNARTYIILDEGVVSGNERAIDLDSGWYEAGENNSSQNQNRIGNMGNLVGVLICFRIHPCVNSLPYVCTGSSHLLVQQEIASVPCNVRHPFHQKGVLILILC